ncbi:ATP-binding protein, partial [Escherichia coli]
EFSCSTNFLDISLYDQPARIYPVFINLVNNSRYWVKETKEERRIIRLDVLDGLIYVSDNGPGVDPDDVSELFTIFFSKKQRGGRGVGLYLCKQNLAVSGHSIFYETRTEKKILNGANFVINFKGIKNA